MSQLRPGILTGLATRRDFLAAFAAMVGLPKTAGATEFSFLRDPGPFHLVGPNTDIVADVLPKLGVPTGLAFGNSLQVLIAAGVLDPKKFRTSDKNLPGWVERLVVGPSDDPIIFSEQTAPYLVDLLWPIGLSNKVRFNEKSPISTLRIPGFASTGGWSLGREPNGYVYFNRVEVVRLSDQQEAKVLDVASNTYRPCCDNSTIFQDCNHGSALLGLLELGASQGMTTEGLYGLALTANSFWFPENYAKTALYFSHFHRASWREISPKILLGHNFSSLSGWENNIDRRLQQANVSLPGRSSGQQSC